MDRHTFIGVLGLAATPLPAAAQPTGTIYRIGLLAAGTSPWIIDPFLASMREAGWLEGRDFVMEARYTGASQDRAPALATELVDLKVDVILVLNTANAAAARQASHSVPVVMLLSGYPVEAGLAASVGRPGGNVTGLSIYAGVDLCGKCVQLLKEVRPDLRTFATGEVSTDASAAYWRSEPDSIPSSLGAKTSSSTARCSE